MNSNYHTSRFKPDPRRDRVWKYLWLYFFSKRIRSDQSVLDLGSGYGHFINNVVAKKRIAIDNWKEFKNYLAPGVDGIVSEITNLSQIPDHSVDFAFASNVFEHIEKSELEVVLSALRSKLSKIGTLTILQPNYRFAYKEYFDDYTHKAIYSHISLTDFLEAQSYKVLEVHPKFLPLTVKSKFPVWGWVIWVYLKLPFRPFGKQMLIVAQPLS